MVSMCGLLLQELTEKYDVSVVPTFVAFMGENKVRLTKLQ